MTKRTPPVLLGFVLVIGVTLIAFGTLLLVAPMADPSRLDALAWFDPSSLLVFSGIGLILLSLAALGIVRHAEEPPQPLSPDRNSTEMSVDDPTHLDFGADFDALIERSMADDAIAPAERSIAEETLHTELRSIAAAAYARQAGCSYEEALDAVEAGEWSDDVRAAAFLADTTGPKLPWRVWLVDLVRSSNPDRRSLEHTVAAIERLHRDMEHVE